MRLDIAAGTAVRFEPGQTRDVQLVALAGKRVDLRFSRRRAGEAVNMPFVTIAMPCYTARHPEVRALLSASRRMAHARTIFNHPSRLAQVGLAPQDARRWIGLEPNSHVRKNQTFRLCRHVRAHHRRPGAAGRYRSHHRGREGFHHLRRGGEVRRRQGDPRRHGAVAGHQQAGRGRYRHHQCADRRSLGHRQGRRRDQGRHDRRDRQGRQSRHPARRHHRDRPRHRRHRGRGQDPHRRRFRQPHPFHLPAADRARADVRRHLDARRRHRPVARHLCDHLHARALAHGADDPVVRRVPGQSRHFRQGQRLAPGRAGRDDQGRRLRAEAARGLGHHAGGDRQLPRRSPTITTSR